METDLHRPQMRAQENKEKCHRSSLHLCVKQEGSLVCSLVPTFNIMTNRKGHTLETHMKNPKHQHYPHITQKTARGKDG